MKIGIFGTRGIPAQYGGFETLAENLAGQMNRMGHQVFVTGFSKSEDSQGFPGSSGVTSIDVFINCPSRLENLLGTWKACKKIERLTKLDAAIVLNDVNFFIALKYNNMGIPTILHLDGAEAKRSGLPVFGKIAHHVFRKLAVMSNIHLVVDSVVIKKGLNLNEEKMSVISYASHLDAPNKPNYPDIKLHNFGYLVAVARFVSENQLVELIEAFSDSGRNEELVLIGLGTGSRKYEAKVMNAAAERSNIKVLPKNYSRSEINWLLQNTKAYLHGHSVGGTNPILVDARRHSRLILSHNNSFNRENMGPKEHLWSDKVELVSLLENIDELGGDLEEYDYNFDTWEGIAQHYLELLTSEESIG